MARKRPGSVTAAGVMAIIYGSLFTLCGLCGAVGLVLQNAAGPNFMGGGDPNQAKFQKELKRTLEQDIPAYAVYQIAGAVLGLALAVVLLVGGIGLLRMNSWARKTVIIVGTIALLWAGFRAVFSALYEVPATNKAVEAAPPVPVQKGQGPGAAEAAGLVVAFVVGAVVVGVAVQGLFAVYLLIMVLLLRRPHVRAAFAATGDEDQSGELDQSRRDSQDDGWGASRPPDDDEGHFRS